MKRRLMRLHEWGQDHLGVAIWLIPLCSVALIIFFITEIIDIDRLGVYYGAIYVVTSLFCCWNIWDRFWDWRSQVVNNRPDANIKLARWRLNQNIMIGSTAFAAAIAGVISTFALAPMPAIVACLFISGIFLLSCAVWDRSARWEVIKEIELEKQMYEQQKLEHQIASNEGGE